MERSDQDPYPVKNRGIYFSGQSFLESVNNISLNIEFTISFFSKALDNESINSSLWLSENLDIRPGGVGRFCFFDGMFKYCELSYPSTSFVTWWIFTSFSVSYNETSRLSLVTRTINHYTQNAMSVQSHIFLNEPSEVWIGKGEVNFKGFIYE